MRRRLELLAPAKDLNTARAAIAAGADAVFIGGPAFGARAAAGNSLSDLNTLCAEAHRFGVKIHLTLNTLLYDDELKAAQELIDAAAEAGVDALIVQDAAVFALNIPPGIELHVSTQCNLDSVEKLRFYAALGAAQAVLPRELSLSEIAAYHQACPELRLEVFVAGALCVGQSGICYISEFMQGRSANRGQCAQICRLPMRLLGPDGKLIKEGHLLSLKDNLALHDLPSLIAAGVSSFKIEGRLKDALYVKNQTAAFSSALNDFIKAHPDYERASFGVSRLSFVPDPARTFNRGFTAAYLKGSNDLLYADKTPKFMGLPCAVVESVKRQGRGLSVLLKVKPGLELANGDAFTFFDRSGELTGFRANTVRQQGRQAEVQINVQVPLTPGLHLARNVDIKFERALSDPQAAVRTLELTCTVSCKEGRLQVTYTDAYGRQGRAALALKPDPKAAALPSAVLEDKCRRTALPAFTVSKVLIEGAADIKLPLSAFNALRREAFADFIKQAERFKRSAGVSFKLPEPLPQYPERTIDERLVTNAVSRNFWRRCGAEPSKSSEQVLMTCRNCLIKNYARCSQDGGRVTGFKLDIGGRRFALKCRCRECRMLVVQER